MREANAPGERLGLSEEELAFYDALETNDSAVKVLGDETLRTIARELTKTVRQNVTVDWTLRENVRAHLRVLVKRILRKYGYPPDKESHADGAGAGRGLIGGLSRLTSGRIHSQGQNPAWADGSAVVHPALAVNTPELIRGTIRYSITQE